MTQLNLWSNEKRSVIEQWFADFPMLQALSNVEIARRCFRPFWGLRNREMALVAKEEIKLVRDVRKTLKPWHDVGGWADWITTP
jgi:hypothetical protein